MIGLDGKEHWGLVIFIIRCVIFSRCLGVIYILSMLFYLLQPFLANVVSTRASTHATGTIQIKLGLVEGPQSKFLMHFNEVYAEFVRRSRPSHVSAPSVRLSLSLSFT